MPMYPDRAGRSRVYFYNVDHVVDPYLIAVTKRPVPSSAASLMRPLSASTVHAKLLLYRNVGRDVNHARIKPASRRPIINCLICGDTNVAVGEENWTRDHRPRSADDKWIRGGNNRDRAGKLES